MDRMPTVLKVEGYRFFFYSNEGNEPPHIHISKGSGVAKFWLSPVELSASSGFNSKEQRRIRELTKEHEHDFIQAWKRYFS